MTEQKLQTERPQGKVWLVGAGPGDAGLLTLKGKAVLGKAQVVVYDALISAELLTMISTNAKRIYVGKRAGNHAMPQEEINRLLVEYALQGLRVVRLKGGDPFLFGRGGEELLALREHGIDYEVVPGVTSAIAVPAYNGIPVTHRGFSGSVHIITGHRQAGEPLDLPFEAYANAKGTLVFLMGVSALGEIVHGLLTAGMSGDTPAALLEQGTTAAQRRVVATLETLEAAAARERIGTPAIIVVGAVAALSQELDWYERLPLFGKRFILTRPTERMEPLASALRARGAQVLELPAIELHAMEKVDGMSEAMQGVREHAWDCLVFTSPAGVQTFFELLITQGLDSRCLGDCRIAAIGSGTAQALRAHGLLTDFMPETYNGIALGTLLAEQLPDGSRVLIPRSKLGNPKLISAMEERGRELGKRFLIRDLPIYELAECSFAPEELPELSGVSGVFFTSASTVRGFLKKYPRQDVTGLTALCIGEMTAEAASTAGMQVMIAEEASVEGLVSLAERMMDL